MDAGTCPECGAALVAGAPFCAGCGAAVGPVRPDEPRSGQPRSGGTAAVGEEPPDERSSPRRWAAVAGLVVALVGVLALVRPPADSDDAATTAEGVAGGTPLPTELVLRWDVEVPGVGGPVGPGSAPVRLDGGVVAVADVVVGPGGDVVAARPLGVLGGRTWAAAAPGGLVLGDVATGAVSRTEPWPDGLQVTPTGPARAWVDTEDGGVDVVLATSDGGSVRLGLDGTLRWVGDALPLVGDRAVASGPGPFVPARTRVADGGTAAVLDLRDGRIVARVDAGLQLLAVGHGMAVTADDAGVVAAWPLAAPSPQVLPGGASPQWEVAMAPGRPVAVDVLPGQRFAVHGMDSVVGEVRLVDAGDGTVTEVVAGWPNADLDGGRTAEAFDEVVAGVVGDELRRFAWDGTPQPPVALGSEGWFVTRGDDLVQLVARRTGAVVLAGADGTVLPADAPPPASGDGARIVAVAGGAVGIAGGVASPTAVRWVDARTGEVGVPPPAEVPTAPTAAPLPPDVLDVVGPVAGDLVVVGPAAVARVDDAGAERWRRDLGVRPALSRSTTGAAPGIVVTSSHVVVPLADGTVAGVRWDDGVLDWVSTTGVVRALVGAADEVLVSTVTGQLLRLGAGGQVTVVADLGAVATAIAVAGDVVVALLPGRLVGIGPPGGPIPDEDRVDVSAARLSGSPVPLPGRGWHAAPADHPSSTVPGG